MTVFIAAISVGVFLLAFWRANVIPTAKAALLTVGGAMRAMRDPALDEMTRERTVQKAAIGLLVASGSLVLRSFLAVAAAFAPILVADWTGLVPQAAILAFMERPDVILVVTLVTLGLAAGARVWTR